MLILPSKTHNKIIKIIEKKNFTYFIPKKYNREQESLLLTINIPKINLHKKVYQINSKENNVNKNIQILSASNINKNKIILASHSGTNNNAYFNNLNILNLKDNIYIKKENNIFNYKINNIYYINKTGYLEIEKDLLNTLILITCSKKDKNKQLIIKSKLVSINNVK